MTRIMFHKHRKFDKPTAKAVSGFDYPTQVVGTSKWTGSDGKPVTVLVDPATGASGLAVAGYVLTNLDALMATCDAWFGIRGQGGNLIIAPDFGGAYHYSCSFDTGGDWYLSLSGNDTTLGLAAAEIVESYMGLQAKGWPCGGSSGESLSRFLAEIATGGAGGALLAYASGPTWDGGDWISKDQGTDQDYPSIGCGVLYLWWMVKLGFTVQQVVQAGQSDGTLASNYAALTGKPKAQAFTDFQNAVGMDGSAYLNDDWCNVPNPPYPLVGPQPPAPVPVPPGPPAPPAPAPSGSSGSFAIELSGTIPTVFGQSELVTFTGTVTPVPAIKKGRGNSKWPT